MDIIPSNTQEYGLSYLDKYGNPTSGVFVFPSSVKLDPNEQRVPFPFTKEQVDKYADQRTRKEIAEAEENYADSSMEDSLEQKWWFSQIPSGSPYYSYIKELYQPQNEAIFNDINYVSNLQKYAKLLSANQIIYNKSQEEVYNGTENLGSL